MLRRPVFWITAVVVCVAAGIFAFIYFPRAFPIVSVDIRMDREGALVSARELSERFGWGPEDYRQAASFSLTPQAQEFIELEGGGLEAFRGVLAGGVFHPYRWTVRHFKERERNETRIRFTPGGDPYGFVHVLAEDAPGAALSEQAALAIAERAASVDWGIDLAAFERVETSQETRPGDRIDHTFEYERTGARFGDGQLRLRLVVGGDELTELTHYLEVPEAFSRRYAEMRSTNDLIGALGSVGALLGYLLVGCSVALFFLFRERWVVWRQPVYWGVGISALQVLVAFDQLPLLWMGYDTALSSRNFLLQQIGVALGLFIVMAGIFAVSFMAAETMTRRAFPEHIQLWRSWSPGVANSPTIAGFTIIGFLLLGVFFAYEVALYLVAHNMLGWWSPSGALGEPDVLATYFPWLTAIAVSLQAGFWEECLFRAVPLAGAALLGKRFGRPKTWIFAAFIIQALIFGAGHAAYPTQPAYARVVELMIPSFGFGLIYLYFGLVPAIVLHYAYDVVWFAMPLFVQSAPGAWIDRTILLAFLFVPLLVVFWRRAAATGWVEVSAGDYNRGWQPAPLPERADVPLAPVDDIGVMHPTVRRLLPVAGIVGLALWFGFSAWSTQATSLRIGRLEAIDVARQELASRGIDLEPEWRALPLALSLPSPSHRFVWQEGGEEPFNELAGTYLGLPRWQVRFARFEGDVAERAEEYVVQVSGEGEVVRFIHRLPEARPGADLSEEEARQVAGREIRRQFGLPFGTPDEEGGLTEISAETSKRPERRDWTFTFEDPDNFPLEQGSARVVVTVVGDEASNARRFVHVPEDWTRTDRNRNVVPDFLSIVTAAIAALTMLAGAVAGGMAWAKGSFSIRTFLVFLSAVSVLTVVQFANNWPATMAGLQTALPISSQIVILLVGIAIAAVGLSAALGLVAGWTQRALDSGGSVTGFGETLWVGACLGMFVAGVRTAVGAVGPSLTPPWADYAAANAFSPLLETALGPAMGLLNTTLFLLLVCTATGLWTSGWTRRTRLFSLLLVMLGFLGATSNPQGPIAWMASGLAVGVLLLGAYQFVLRYDLAVLPVAVATSLILRQAARATFEAYPGSVAGNVAAIAVLAVIATAWAYKAKGAGGQAEVEPA